MVFCAYGLCVEGLRRAPLVQIERVAVAKVLSVRPLLAPIQPQRLVGVQERRQGRKGDWVDLVGRQGW